MPFRLSYFRNYLKNKGEDTIYNCCIARNGENELITTINQIILGRTLIGFDWSIEHYRCYGEFVVITNY
jgi:hypothetical protein